MSDWFSEGSANEVDVRKVLDSTNVLDLLAECIQLGALAGIGTTKDGGAMGVTITVDGAWRREYFRDGQELELWLQGAVGAVRQATASPIASSGQRQRPRRSRSL